MVPRYLSDFMNEYRKKARHQGIRPCKSMLTETPRVQGTCEMALREQVRNTKQLKTRIFPLQGTAVHGILKLGLILKTILKTMPYNDGILNFTVNNQ